MKEDILEQIGSDWLLQKEAKFIKTNLKYKPDENDNSFDKFQDNIHSDIDILSIDLTTPEIITVINCKSWMDGFDCRSFNNHLSDDKKLNKKMGGKEYWKHFRDLINPKWHMAFIERIKKENPKFKVLKYIVLTVFAKNKIDMDKWILNPLILQNFKYSGIKLESIEVKELNDLIKEIDTKNGLYAENSDFCRTLQLLRSAKIMEN